MKFADFQYLGKYRIASLNSPLFQSRLAVNAVTLGDYEAPLRISVFVKDLFAGFSMVKPLKTFIARFDMPSLSELNQA